MVVKLDPWQLITEVGWGGNIKWVAYAHTFTGSDGSSQVFSPDPCSFPYITAPPVTEWTSTYAVSASSGYGSSPFSMTHPDGETETGLSAWNADGEPTGAITGTVKNIPNGQSHSIPAEQCAQSLPPPYYEAATGGPHPLGIVDGGGNPYVHNLVVSGYVPGQSITGGQVCHGDPLNPFPDQGHPAQNVDTGYDPLTSSTWERFAHQPYNFNGLYAEATINEKMVTFNAKYIATNGDDDDYVSILFERI